MIEGGGTVTPDIERLLTGLIDDPDFSRLNATLGRFNIFEAVGAVRAELRHSNFLAYLLSPLASHGLGSEPLRAVLRTILKATPSQSRPLGELAVAVGELEDALVRREQDNMDLLIELPRLRLAVVIENKIDSAEGNGQLARYMQVAATRYAGWRRLFVFLTPDGMAPSVEGYCALSYAEIADALDAVLARVVPAVAGDSLLVLRHYVDLLRRHIVPDPSLQDLAARIYQRHREALDFIFESRPEPGSLLTEMRELLATRADLVRDRDSRTVLRFQPAAWGALQALNSCPADKWTGTGRGLLFEVKSYRNEEGERIVVALVVGPLEQTVRKQLHDLALGDKARFPNANRIMGRNTFQIFGKNLLSAKEFRDLSEDDRPGQLREAWKEFAAKDLPGLTAAVAGLFAPQQDAAAPAG